MSLTFVEIYLYFVVNKEILITPIDCHIIDWCMTMTSDRTAIIISCNFLPIFFFISDVIMSDGLK
jgi:hypothetical protein